MLTNARFVKLATLPCALVLLCQCTKVEDVQTPLKKQVSTPFSMPASAYLALANNQPDEERQTMLIMAAGRYLYEDKWQDALNILAQTSTLSVIQSDEKNILLAKIESIQQKPRAAIEKLSSIKQLKQLPTYFQAQYHDVLASSYEAVGNASLAVAERMKVDPLLSDDESRKNNRSALWLTLTKLPEPELATLALEAKEGSDFQGWTQLALIPKQASSHEHSLLDQVAHWKQKYPDHPANSLLPASLSSVKPYLQGTPEHLALLLPISGPLAGPGGAIRDGFLAAYHDRHSNQKTKVKLYDTAAGDVEKLYEQALADGADYVVGPLTKNDVMKVAAMPHPVPTLLLNDVDLSNSNNAYQFGLSPSNEARQVAVKARKNGYSRALVIAPAGAWGDELVGAFSKQWQSSGGVVVDRLAYDNNTDLNQSVRTTLHVSEKVANEKQVKPVAGKNTPSQAKRRQDMDMIFMIAYPSKARQIMPLLKYYFAGDIPVYATSTVYAGSTNLLRDRDLNGLIFCDMPWVFNHQMTSKNWPEQLNSYSRLYALGMDSYALSTQLNQLMLFPSMGMSDNSGVLYLNQMKQVARVPMWGKFKNGVAVPIS
jgi:outer membrane PBP1 activator LpoA protein